MIMVITPLCLNYNDDDKRSRQTSVASHVSRRRLGASPLTFPSSLTHQPTLRCLTQREQQHIAPPLYFPPILPFLIPSFFFLSPFPSLPVLYIPFLPFYKLPPVPSIPSPPTVYNTYPFRSFHSLP